MIVLRLADYDSPSFSSPVAGERLGKDLVAAMKTGPVELDFSGVRSVLTVALNPAIVPVYKAFDREAIITRLKPTGMSGAHQFAWKHVLDTARLHSKNSGALRQSNAELLNT
jgi:hypothetical protein